MDTVGFQLQDVIKKLDNEGWKYTIQYTYPTRDYFPLDETMVYVVKQQQGNDGSLNLIVAATMGKGV